MLPNCTKALTDSALCNQGSVPRWGARWQNFEEQVRCREIWVISRESNGERENDRDKFTKLWIVHLDRTKVHRWEK